MRRTYPEWNHSTTPPERIWVTREKTDLASVVRYFHASDTDHGTDYPEYLRADIAEEALKEADWHSPHETPGFCGANARRVLVKIERIDNPPEMNLPPRYAFGHRIVNEGNEDWPADGWFFDGQDKDYRVVAWRYIETPSVTEALARATNGGRDDG